MDHKDSRKIFTCFVHMDKNWISFIIKESSAQVE